MLIERRKLLQYPESGEPRNKSSGTPASVLHPVPTIPRTLWGLTFHDCCSTQSFPMHSPACGTLPPSDSPHPVFPFPLAPLVSFSSSYMPSSVSPQGLCPPPGVPVS